MKVTELQSKTILSKTGISIAEFVINTYRGCSHGCAYCYAKFMKRYSEKQDEWGEFVDIKINAPELLRKEIKRKNIKKVLIGSVTDVYQPLEEKYKLTRRVLEVLDEFRISCVILTKSDLVLRDIDILSRNPGNEVCFTINTTREEVPRAFEKNTPPIAARIKAVEKLNKSGVNAYVHAGPVLPYLTDIDNLLRELNGKTEYVDFESLNLKMASWNNIKRVLQENFPNLVAPYESIFFSRVDYGKYLRDLKNEVMELNKNYGFGINFYLHPFDTYFGNIEYASKTY